MKNAYFMFPETARNLLALSRARRELHKAKRVEARAHTSHPLFRNAVRASRLRLQTVVFDLETALGLNTANAVRVENLWRGSDYHA